MSVSLKLPLDVIKVIDGFCYNCKRKRRCIKTPFFKEIKNNNTLYLLQGKIDDIDVFKSKCFDCSSFTMQGSYKKLSLMDQVRYENFNVMICEICNMNAKGLFHLNRLKERDRKLFNENKSGVGLRKFSKSLNDIIDELESEKNLLNSPSLSGTDSENDYEDDNIDLYEHESRLSIKNTHASKILKLKNFLYHDDIQNTTLCRLCFLNQLKKYEYNMFHFFMAMSFTDEIMVSDNNSYERLINILSKLKIIELKFKILKIIYPCCIKYKKTHQQLWNKMINRYIIAKQNIT